MPHINIDLALSFMKCFYTSVMKNIYVQFEDRLYQQIVVIPIGSNCAHFKADLVLYVNV